jgi:hypothetical protein
VARRAIAHAAHCSVRHPSAISASQVAASGSDPQLRACQRRMCALFTVLDA